MIKRHKLHVVKLSVEERSDLEAIASRPGVPVRKQLRAKLLLLADQSHLGPAMTDVNIAQQIGLSVRTVETVRRRYATEGIERALEWRTLPASRDGSAALEQPQTASPTPAEAD